MMSLLPKLVLVLLLGDGAASFRLSGRGAAGSSSSDGRGALQRGKQRHRKRLDLQKLVFEDVDDEATVVQRRQRRQPGVMLSNATVDGQEIACLGCNQQLFQLYVAQRSEEQRLRAAAAAKLQAAGKSTEKKEEDKSRPAGHGKHPNSPGYDEWAQSMAAAPGKKEDAFLQLRGLTKKNVSDTDVDHADKDGSKKKEAHVAGWIPDDVPKVETHVVSFQSFGQLRPRLQTLWHDRRLVMGTMSAAGLLEEPVDFPDTMVNLARESPALTPPNCDLKGLPACGALFSGAQNTDAKELRRTLDATFGAAFLKAHEYDPKAPEAENRKSLQVLLSALKTNYSFYYQTCLTHDQAISGSCDKTAQSMLLGQSACREETDRDQDDCVYGEVRFCPKCGDGAPFFEYERFHGPLTLLAMKETRNGVMGQCEEFSRAAHALLSSCGYETRYVLDFTDHVWVEVRLPHGEKGEWIHADPSEGVLDSPLMYEQGWGKQLTMIFAFTPKYIEHVTPRYTADYPATVQRRGIDEAGLNELLQEANERLRMELPRTEFGFQSGHGEIGGASLVRRSGDRDLREIAFWSHFEK